jgi:hypothetical protein
VIAGQTLIDTFLIRVQDCHFTRSISDEPSNFIKVRSRCLEAVGGIALGTVAKDDILLARDGKVRAEGLRGNLYRIVR